VTSPGERQKLGKKGALKTPETNPGKIEGLREAENLINRARQKGKKLLLDGKKERLSSLTEYMRTTKETGGGGNQKESARGLDELHRLKKKKEVERDRGGRKTSSSNREEKKGNLTLKVEF